jgi:Na+/proline symporter
MGIFTAQAGGTFLGNLIRSAASGLSGGILGQGKDKINADGTKGNGDTSPWYTDALSTLGYVAAATPQGSQILTDVAKKNAAAAARNNWFLLGIIGALVAACGFLFVNRK